MNVLEIFKAVANLFIYYWSLEIRVGDFTLTVGSAVAFVMVVCIICAFIKGIS